MFKSIIILITAINSFLLNLSYAQFNFNQVVQFNGTNSYIAVPNQTDVNPLTGVTIEAWVYLLSYTSVGSYHTIYGKNFASSNALFINSGGAVRFYPRGGVGQYMDTPPGNVPLKKWTHVAATYDGSISRIYINGVQTLSSTAFSGNINQNTDSVYIGCDRSGSRFYFLNGYLDDVRLWKAAKTQSQIQRDMYVPLGTISASGIYTSNSCAWRLDNNLFDEAGNLVSSAFPRNISFVDLSQKAVNYTDYNGTLVLNGSTDYCSSTAFPANFSSPDAITLEAWIRQDTAGIQANIQNVVNRSGGTTRNNYALYISSGGTLFFSINDGAHVISKTGVLGLNRWYHVAASYSSSTGIAKLYVDGDSVASTTFPGNPLIADDPDNIFVGGIGASSFTANKFNGQIDEVRIWKNTVRATDEIRNNMYINLNFLTQSLSADLIVFGFDGSNYNARSAPGTLTEYLTFSDSAFISSSHNQIDSISTSPLLRDDVGGFPLSNYYLSKKKLYVPDNNINGVIDSVFVPSGTVNNLRVLAMINHTRVSDMLISIINPAGIQTNIFTNSGGSSSNDVMTIFRDDADSLPGTLSNGGFRAPFSPFVKPNNPLSVYNGSNAAGWWKFKVTDNAAGDIGIINAWGIQPTFAVPTTLTLTAFIQGFYNSSTNLVVADTAKVILRSIDVPYTAVDSVKSVLNSSGSGTFNFNYAANAVNYYIEIKHRNSIETWSSTGHSFSSGIMSFDFSSASNQAFGDNQSQIDSSPLRFGIFSGDVDQDGNIDVSDMVLIYNAARNFASGYVVTDVTGDDYVDAADLITAYNNSIAVVGVITP